MPLISQNAIAATNGTANAIELTPASNTCTANITNNLSNRNLIINGAFQIAQRGTSSTTTTGSYTTVDRIRTAVGGHDEAPTFAQADVASGTTPYQKGFRKCFKVTNGNQTSGAGAGHYIQADYYVEAQDVANSGWDITNSNSKLTLSFWIKSSVSQFFTFAIRAPDSSTEQVINFKTSVLTADTWTKITKTIPGNSNLAVNNDNGLGLQIMFFPSIGTTYTTSGLAEDTWSDWVSAKHAIENTTTWWTTNDATFELTGIQLEVSDGYATEFEHRSYGDELARCQRYYERRATGAEMMFTIYAANTVGYITWDFKERKRAAATITHSVWDSAAFGTTGLSIAASMDQARFSWTNGNHGYVGQNTILEASAEL